jgi:hypothetical protein
VSKIRTLVFFAIGLLIASLVVASPASADPEMPSCTGLMILICGVLPSQPDLDHDVDLTSDQPKVPPAPNEGQPFDICATNGCI